MASAGNPKEKVTTEENKSLSQRAQRSNADFSLCFFLGAFQIVTYHFVICSISYSPHCEGLLRQATQGSQ